MTPIIAVVRFVHHAVILFSKDPEHKLRTRLKGAAANAPWSRLGADRTTEKALIELIAH